MLRVGVWILLVVFSVAFWTLAVRGAVALVHDFAGAGLTAL